MEYAFCSPEITELSKALIAVQKDLKPALKDAVNPFVHNSYASLGSIMDACRNALIEHDVLLTQYPVPVEGEYLGLVTKLVHAKSGQYQASLAVIPLAKHDPQAMGSAITYGRRYALSAMLGIVPEEDDDGNAACNIMDSSPKRRTPHSAGASRKQAAAQVQANAQSRPSLSTLLADLGLAELTQCYRAYLQDQYGCAPDRLPPEVYNEQKSHLEHCKREPLTLRNFMRTLHSYK
ncbi:ERF family protein [Desulfovibrio piger]|uniref:ERF family protein n=1 Tax=Desulfovibrio piger TaxID=901 RepID=UPI0026EA9A70|nr:ERF family protein [Desulfovibrio piger]